ncbi:hypothetical protein DAEQUDRAFT_200444 [Daedalea quercina L-15889]|uniref:F-box domain-containing protein n=1 Tax=Daedalea quercina L-15889 TaxID=1314783 RepID=A0A165U9D3_9APHY|nr:hypothetical protein DAEQUDRAFT_200444 [Daedalea quercina L-15889]
MPPKKVKRFAASSDVTGSSSLVASENVGTQRKSGGKIIRGRGRGGLKDMLNMPIDIIQEITRRLHPRDLLHLSWKSKSIHAFFMKRTAAYTWKLSLATVPGLPPCPDQLIEPAWATLLFSSYCTGCGTSCTTQPIWEFRARFCQQCYRTKTVASEDPVHDVTPENKWSMSEEIGIALFTNTLLNHVNASATSI